MFNSSNKLLHALLFAILDMIELMPHFTNFFAATNLLAVVEGELDGFVPSAAQMNLKIVFWIESKLVLSIVEQICFTQERAGSEL